MKEKFVMKYTKILFDKLNSIKFLTTSRVSEKCFTRNRKLSFFNIMSLIIRGLTKSIQTELREYMFNILKRDDSCSKQAFCKARQNIKPEAFRELFDTTVEYFYDEAEYKTFNGYRVLAIDGSKINLPNSAELINKYGVQTSQGAPQAQALLSSVYDVLNNIIIDASLNPCKNNERVEAMKHIELLKSRAFNKDILVFDRGYPGAELIYSIENADYKYIMRSSTEFAKWLNYQGTDCTVTHKFKNKNTPTPLKIRVVEIELPTTTEILITNLSSEEFSAEDLKKLYHMRWGIEVEYDTLKNKVELENFSGATDVVILQDFYTSLLLSNYAYFFVYENEDKIAKKNISSERKFEYKQNIKQTIESLRDIVINAIASGRILKMRKAIKYVQKELLRAVSKVEENRSYDREKKHKSSKFSITKR